MGRLISESGYKFLDELRRQGKLSKKEYDICVAADEHDDPNIFLRYFTYRPEMGMMYCPHCKAVSSMCKYPEMHKENWIKSGIQLSDWQIKLHFGDYEDIDGNPAYTIFLLGGPGVGKSTFLAVSSFVHCALNPGYREITAAPLKRQNEGVEGEINKWLKGTLAWRIFMDNPPVTKENFIKYHFANKSEHWIMTSGAISGGVTGAKSMLSMESDRIDYDEAGNDRHFPITFVTLGTRTRGTRADGTPRGITMPDGSRRVLMVVISNPNDQDSAEEFNAAVHLARTFPGHKVIEIGLESNVSLAKSQRRAVETRTILGYLAGGRTEQEALDYLAGRSHSRRGEVFETDAIERVVDKSYVIPQKYFRRKIMSGENMTGTNMTFLLPPVEKEPYLITCDPGTGRAPNRNAPAILVWNIKNPEKGVLTGMFWGSLEPGRPESYLFTLAEWIKLHGNAYALIDTTGPQAVLVGHKYLKDVSQYIVPVDMSGTTKRLVQFITSMAASRGRFVLPALNPPYNFEAQLARYRFDDKKIAQDLVVGIMLFAYWQYTSGVGEGYEEEDQSIEGTGYGSPADLIASVRHRGHSTRRGHSRQ